MKNFLLLILAMFYLESKAQSQRQTTGDTILYEAGAELYKYHKKKTSGNILSISGGILFGLGLGYKEDRFLPTFQIIGGAMMLVGTLMIINASTHIGNAGILIMTLSGNNRAEKLSRRQSRLHIKSRF